MNAIDSITAVFGRTEAGLLAALVEDLAWLALPHPAGLRILGGWRLARAMEAWTAADFFGAEGLVPDEDGFRAHVEEAADHRRQLRTLGRRSTRAVVATPWGAAQGNERYADGIVFHSTAGHGGFHLAPEQNLAVHAMLRNPTGWYEEDAEWAKVAFTYPALFTTKELRQAHATIRNDQPDAWEAILGIVLLPGESRVKDERRFRRDHADRWVVISARRSTDRPGMVECLASRAGTRHDGERRGFLVASGEYDPGRFGFVIDEARHERLDRIAAAGA
ncbi:MAG: hypothetical protein ABIO86_04130 [Sphingomonas sp.]